MYFHAGRQEEVEGLYRRFRALDRGRKGYISAEEFLAIPELSINPIASRLVRIYETLNFKEFTRLLSAFSPRASRDVKLDSMFMVFDVDGDGILSKEDLLVMFRQLGGSTLEEEELGQLVELVLKKAGVQGGQGMDRAVFKQALLGSNLGAMIVEVPAVDR